MEEADRRGGGNGREQRGNEPVDVRRVTTHFRATCPATSVHLLLSDETGEALMLVQMDALAGGGDAWQVAIKLAPGAYRYRYYAYDGRLMTYLSPRDVEDGRVHMDGLDAVLTVAGETSIRPCPVEHVDQAARLRWLVRHAGEHLAGSC